MQRPTFGFILAGLTSVWLSAGSTRADGPKVEQDKRPRLVAQLGHSSWVRSVAFAPDGKQVLTGSMDNTARLWDARTGKELRTFTGYSNGVKCVAFSPDGKQVLIGGGDNTAQLRDAQTGKELRTFTGPSRAFTVFAVAISPDGKQVLTCGQEDNTARLWDTHSGEKLRTFTGHSQWVISVAFAPGGKQVVTGSNDRTARLWDVQSGKQLQTFTGHSSAVRSVAFTPDGKQVLTGSGYAIGESYSGGDHTARLWDVQSGKELRTFTGHASGVDSVAFSPDGKQVLTGSRDRTARLWDAQSGKELRTFAGHSAEVNSVAFAPDGKWVLTGSDDATVRLWDVQSGKQLRTFTGRSSDVTSVAFSPDGKQVLMGNYAHTARLWDAQSGKQLRTFRGHSGVVSAVAFAPDGKQVLTGSRDHNARLWDAQSGKQLRTFAGHADPVTSVAFAPDGKQVLTGSDDKTARLWDVQSGKELRTFTGHSSFVKSVAFGPDGKQVLTGSFDNTARLWNVQRSRSWSLRRGKELRTFKGHPSGINAVAFAPDGKQVLTGSYDKTARLWDVQSGKPLRTFAGPSDVSAVAFGPDGKQVLTGDLDGTARLWDVQGGKELRAFVGHSSSVGSVAFSVDSKQVLTGSLDGTARLWDARSGRELCRLISFSDDDWAVVDSEGRFDASNGGDVEGLHWVLGMEPVALKQLKERYYDPGLLAKYLGFNKEPLRQVEAFRDVKLFPDVDAAEVRPGDKKLMLGLTNRGGGIGRVQVLVNGKELLADARGPKPDPDAKKATLTVDLSDVQLIPGQPNKVEVVTWNAEGYLSSRGLVRVIPGPTEAAEPIQLYAVVVGVGTYANPALNLRYAAKDAEDFATAMLLGSKRLFGADKVHLTLLATSDHPQALKPTKENLARAFADLKRTRPGDVVVVYLAGHGAALRQGSDLYCYLTADARSLDPQALADPAVRTATAVSSEELAEWIKQIPALKQVMMLDTCAAGAAAVKLTEKRDVSGDQVRAIERLKDRTGFHVLMGCSTDRVSYEASQYAQGLLTYSLLEGMCGAALQKDNVDVSRLFQYAADRVPELARNIGGVQRPLIAAPRGTSFDVGRLEADDRAKVPLARVKPLVLRPTLLNQEEAEDSLQLTALLRQRLSDASLVTARGKDAAIVYVAEDEFPGAVRPTGVYTIEGDKVSVRITLKRDGVVAARLTVEGSKGSLPALADKLSQAVLAAAK
jgi:WD40 repeat protein/uncharacterized caspase-like protein